MRECGRTAGEVFRMLKREEKDFAKELQGQPVYYFLMRGY